MNFRPTEKTYETQEQFRIWIKSSKNYLRLKARNGDIEEENCPKCKTPSLEKTPSGAECNHCLKKWKLWKPKPKSFGNHKEKNTKRYERSFETLQDFEDELQTLKEDGKISIMR